MQAGSPSLRTFPARMRVGKAFSARSDVDRDLAVQHLFGGAEIDILLPRRDHDGCDAIANQIGDGAADAHEPHRIAFYLYDLASDFHALWTLGNASPHLRFIIPDDRELTMARLVLVQGVVTVLGSGLSLLGVGAPEEMR